MLSKCLVALSASVVLSLLPTPILAQRPANTSICDYYTTALLQTNTPAAQFGVLSVLVNTVVIGNYTQPNVGIHVPGILARGVFNGEAVNLLPFFSGCFNSSNRNGTPVSRNFLDGGGAASLMQGLPGTVGSRQELVHTLPFPSVRR
jgi:hypothetical protein